MIKKLDKRAEKAEKKTPNSTRHALKTRVDSTPSLSHPPKNAPAWAVVTESGTSSIVSTPSDATTGESPEPRPPQKTPEAPPGLAPNPRRLAAAQSFQNLYDDDSSSSSSESDTD